MSLPQTVARVLKDHVTLSVECIDRMYLNLYVPILQRERGIAYFWQTHRGHIFASSALMAPMSRTFVASIERFARRHRIPVITFRKGERKDDVVRPYLDNFRKKEGVYVIGKAQEKVQVVRTVTRTNPETGKKYPWLQKSTAMVNQYYFYALDRDFGPFFLKLSSYFPYNGKLCLNGHEYVKRQLDRLRIAHEPLDNGIRWCEDPARLQKICDRLTASKIRAFTRQWLKRLPRAFLEKDRRAGFNYDISILQAEFSLTQTLDRPVMGRVFFEQVFRENLDLGRPDQVQLIFSRRVTRRTPGRFRTRILTRGVTPTLHIDYKSSKIKQYHKENQALRTETVINNTRDFDIGRRLLNLPALREVGFRANRRLLGVQMISHDCVLGDDVFQEIQAPAQVGTQRAPGLRFGNRRVMALLSSLLVFRLLPRGFTNVELREHMAPLLGRDPTDISSGQMTYDLRRLRLHGLIERAPKSRRYHVTAFGFHTAAFMTRAHNRLLRPGCSALRHPAAPTRVQQALSRLDEEIARLWEKAA